MNLLALEFSSPHRSVAILEYDPGGRFQVRALVSERRSREITGLVLVDKAMKIAGLPPPGINKIAIGLGPGSYTGIRSAIAIAQGWQLAHRIDLAGLSSLEVLAADAKRQGLRDEVNLVIDAQRNELYAARYNLNSDPPTLVEKLHLAPLDALPPGVAAAGPDVQKLLPRAIPLFPSAGTLAELAVEAASRPGEKLEPIYLREISFSKAAAGREIR